MEAARGARGRSQGLEAPVGADREVPLVGQRLGQEARAGDGVVDLGLGPRAGPVLGERGRELGVQFGPRVERQQLAGHVALRLGLGVVIAQIHRARRGVGDGLVHFGPRVEVEQRGDDFGIDLAAVVVAGQGRGDGRGHRAAGGVVGQLAGHVGRDFPLVPVGHQGRGDEGLDLRLVLELGQVQDGSGDRCARFRLGVSLAAGVAVRLYQDGVIQVLERRGQCAGHRQVTQHVAAPEQVEGRAAGPALAVAQRRRRDGGVRLSRGVVAREGCRDCGVRLSGIVITHEGCRDGGVPLGRRPVGHQRIGDGLGHLRRGAVIGQLGVRVALGLVDGRHDGGSDFGSREVIGQSRGDGVVRLLGRARIAREAQGPVVVGQSYAQGAGGVQVTDLVRAGQQVPGHVPQPGGGVDQVGGAAKRGDLCEDAVDGGLQGDLQVAEVSCRGEGPGVLEGEDLRVVSVEAGVLQGLSGLVGRLRQVGQERRGHSLVHVGRGLAGGHIDGQLVHHALQRVGRRHRRQGSVIGGSDAGVHRCSRRMVRQLEVHRGRRGLAVDLDLQGVQGGLVGLTGQAQGQTGVDRGEAGSVGRDETLRCGEVCSQSVGGQVRSCGQGTDLPLQGRDGGGIGADVRGVLGGFRCGVRRQYGGELPGGDALQLDDRWLCHAVVEDPAGEGGWKKAHLL